MKAVRATLYALEIPFAEAFKHSSRERSASDSVVVAITSDAGTIGFGEGVPRPYVTGETVPAALEHIERVLWPAVRGCDLPPPRAKSAAFFDGVGALLPRRVTPDVMGFHASRAAVEIALIDGLLREVRLSLGALLSPKRRSVVYSGVITAGSLERTAQHARQMNLIGLRHVKVKVGSGEDRVRLEAVRKTLGPDVSIRIDANAAWGVDQAITELRSLRDLDIAAVEEPIPRGSLPDLRRVRAEGGVPVVVDESLVTAEDASRLVEERACDVFNVRVSKLGGLGASLEMIRWAKAQGVRVQIGSHVGETAILSAAGRHLAAAHPDIEWVEGSYGPFLLSEDVAAVNVGFGHRGEAPLLTGPGLGIDVLPERLHKHARRVVELS